MSHKFVKVQPVLFEPETTAKLEGAFAWLVAGFTFLLFAATYLAIAAIMFYVLFNF